MIVDRTSASPRLLTRWFPVSKNRQTRLLVWNYKWPRLANARDLSEMAGLRGLWRGGSGLLVCGSSKPRLVL